MKNRIKSHKTCDFRDLRVRHLVVIAAIVCVVGCPLAWVQVSLFGPSERVLSLLSSHFALSPDALTALTMLIYCVMLCCAMLVGGRFLRRFLA